MNTSAISTIRGRSPLPRAQGRDQVQVPVQVPVPVPAPVPTATTRRCSYCGLGGHNRTTCMIRQFAIGTLPPLQPQLRDEGSSMSDEEYETADEEYDITDSSLPRRTGGTNPLELDWNTGKCMCRRWGASGPLEGMGQQCSHWRISGSEFCRGCSSKYDTSVGGPFGRIDQERPIAHPCDGASYEPRGKRIMWKDLSFWKELSWIDEMPEV